jgi:dipeptidyl aminopeptidase/acylaminoacyl peptidase
MGEGVVDGLQDARIHLYAPSSDTIRSLDDTLGVISLTWSPDGGRIAYATIANATGDSDSELRVVDIETGEQEVLTATYHAFHGIGPIWSPDGETIAYQRESRRPRHELHDIVLVAPDDRSEQTGLANDVVLPIERTTADGSSLELFPWHVTWSPDGTYLLYVAWTYPNGCCNEGTVERTVVIAVPTDADAPAVLLAGIDGIGPYDGDTTFVPIQIWQGLPPDQQSPAPSSP